MSPRPRAAAGQRRGVADRIAVDIARLERQADADDANVDIAFVECFPSGAGTEWPDRIILARRVRGGAMKGAGWLVALETRASSVPLFLAVSSDARLGWTPTMDEALVLAREADAGALARYAAARTGKEATVRIWRHPEAQDVLHDDASREIARLRTRVEDLEFLLATIRNLREKDFKRAAQIETERKDDARRHREC